MLLLDLPNELLLLIPTFLEDDCNINALLQTCRQLSVLLNRYLYEHNVRHSHATALEWAAKHGQETTARRALEAGAPLNAVHEEKWLPFALACIHGHEAIVRLLLDHGVDPDPVSGWGNFDEVHDIPTTDDWGYPMMMAAQRGRESVVRLLLAHGAAPDTPTEDEDTPLRVAAISGHLSIVKLLADAGADVNYCDNNGYTPLSMAACVGNTEIVHFLAGMGSDIDNAQMGGQVPLALAARRGRTETVNVLLELGANPTPQARGLTVFPLAKAAEGEDYAVADILRNAMDLSDIISSGDPNDGDHKMLLLVSAACGWDDLVRQLLEHGTQPGAFFSDIDSFRSIRDQNPDILDSQNRPSPTLLFHPSALALAAHRGHLRVVETLLRYGANFHETPGPAQKPSPLYLAISATHRHVVEALLNHGAGPNWKDINGHPVLFRAVRSPEIFQLLLDRGANPHLLSTQKESTVTRALRSGCVATVEILRQRSVFAVPSSTRTKAAKALLNDAARGGRAIVGYLLDRGYKAKPGSPAVKHALQWALSVADAPLASLLFERGLVRGPSPIPGSNPFGLVETTAPDFATVTPRWMSCLTIELTSRPKRVRFTARLTRNSMMISRLHALIPTLNISLSSGQIPCAALIPKAKRLRYHMQRPKGGPRKSRSCWKGLMVSKFHMTNCKRN